MKVVYKKILLCICATIISIILVESLLHIHFNITGYATLDEELREKWNVSEEYLKDACQISKDRCNKYKNREGYNSEGFRDYDFPLEKEHNTYRIVFIGSSWTKGSGVALNETFAKQLELLLNSNSKDISYEVLLRAQGGTHFNTKLCILENNVLKYNPDLVLFSSRFEDLIDIFFINKKVMLDYFHNKTPNPDYLYLLNNKKRLERKNIKLIGAISDILKTPDMFSDVVLLWYNEGLVDEYHSNLIKFKNICKKNNIVCKGFIIPKPLEDNKIHKVAFAQEQLKSAFTTTNFDYFDLSDNFKKYPLIRYRFSNNNHPNPFAHKVIAYSLYNELILNKVLPNWYELKLVEVSSLELEEGAYYVKDLEATNHKEYN